MTRFNSAAAVLSFATLTSVIVATAAACGPADDFVVFKCNQTCGGATASLPDACESSAKSSDDVAKIGEQATADAGIQCTFSCQKTDSPCRQK